MSFRKHRYISKILIFAIIMYCSFITISATGNSGTCGPNTTWSYNEQTRTLTISGSGAISGYEQLTVINGSLARTAAAPWNAYSNEIRSIIIGEGITSIGESAFKHYDNLENLKLPSTLLQIENYAFSRCGSLDRVVIPENVQRIGCNAFLGRYEETKPYIYFLGNAPSVKSAGGTGRSFSDNTTLFYSSGTSGWGGSAWNGYQARPWNGVDFIDPLFKKNSGEDFEHSNLENSWPPKSESNWAPDINNDIGEKIEVIGTKNYSYAYDVINQVNTLRRQNGLHALEIDDKLMNTAMQRAAECSVYYSHTRPNDTSCLDIFPSASVRGENIAAGQSSPSAVVSDWTNSPGHYANMVNDDYTSIGVGCFYIDGHFYWAQSFTSGQAASHTKSGNTQTTVSVPVSSNHFILRSDYSTITAKIDEKVQLPVQLINSGFNNTYTTIQAKVSDYSAPSIVDLSKEPLAITGKQSGTGTVTVRFENGMSAAYYINVTSPYSDVSDSSWYYDAISWADNKNLIDSASQTTFGATLPMSRGMTAELLHRLEGSPINTRAGYFLDITPKYAAAINWVASQGLMTGYGNNIFGPDNALTREQMAAILFRYAQYKGIDTSARADISRYEDSNLVSNYAMDAMRWANSTGLISGTSTSTLSPARNITRAEAAAIFMRFSERYYLS